MIRLTSTAKTMQLFHLVHEKAPRVRMEVAVAIPSKDGTGGFRRQLQRVPSSLSLAKGETTGPLPDWVEKCADVLKATKARLVKVSKVAEAEEVPVVPPANPPPAPLENLTTTETVETIAPADMPPQVEATAPEETPRRKR